uniref:Aminotransferase class V domain-containing protein n=2 Tax=Neobodo designis TaxID=312471 RepID=A0A7S1W7M3_NEODS|mmetsp:Transcript_5739/g.18019  ORF Transcript_5739/g.18019 Transcript_5739/m.18019 type:complete len:399 (+) Transcript_5739:46-1242(+)|eukprot:CAMPEP_0174855434 /NCGR_PEP_ID=MMETSP1114-20130205/33254_1 /TAXON_ID=312471 /ORGANISM="Neobodo designis, Strain CCAP 1951/1" /LENGTH=398 /DNA_ID=CAMNT_0016090173 /DNA_START=43 /DNA_END=1239 /DNA_ORIENTATION=+
MRRMSARLAAAGSGAAANAAAGKHSRLPLLFTAGPLQTSMPVKEAMLRDYGSRDAAFVQCIKDVRSGLVRVGDASPAEWTGVPMQGSGTMGIEAAIRTTTPRKGALVAVVTNGSYGARIASICDTIGVECVRFKSEEGAAIDLAALEAFVKEHGARLTNFAIVHCETSTGMFNPIHDAARIVRQHAPQATIILDAMSSFGAVPFKADDVCDIMISSANKCIQGVPGFSVILARKALLEKCRGNSTSYTLDVCVQNDGLDKTGQFPNTPPVHAMMAFRQALIEHTEEGGVAARAQRYKALATRTAEGMKALGFTLFLEEGSDRMGYIITAYNTPKHPKWNFVQFNDRLREKGVVLYPGKASHADTFRIGSLGDLYMDDVEMMLAAVSSTMEELGINLLE